MRMSREQALESLKRIYASHHFAGGVPQQIEYAQSVLDVCGFMDAYRFEQTVKRLVENWTSNYLPKPGHYLSTYKVLSGENGWDKQDREKWSCEPCGSSGFVRTRVIKDLSGQSMTYDALVNCPKCRSNWYKKDEDLVFDESPQESFYVKAARLSKGDGAAFIYDKIMERGLQIPDMEKVLAIVVEQASKYPPTGKKSAFAEAVDAVAPPAVPVAPQEDIKF